MAPTRRPAYFDRCFSVPKQVEGAERDAPRLRSVDGRAPNGVTRFPLATALQRTSVNFTCASARANELPAVGSGSGSGAKESMARHQRRGLAGFALSASQLDEQREEIPLDVLPLRGDDLLRIDSRITECGTCGKEIRQRHERTVHAKGHREQLAGARRGGDIQVEDRREMEVPRSSATQPWFLSWSSRFPTSALKTMRR